MSEYTTIRISRKLYRALWELREPGEPWDKMLWRLVKRWEEN